MSWQLLLIVVVFSAAFGLEAALASADHAELHQLAGAVSRGPARLRLHQLESMWHSSVGKEVGGHVDISRF